VVAVNPGAPRYPHLREVSGVGAGFLFYDPRDATQARRRTNSTRVLPRIVRILTRVAVVVAAMPLAGEVATGVMRVMLGAGW
jgi:hypothetical protein